LPGELVVSLDFELLWGVRDHRDRESYGANVLGARKAIPRMLDLFERYGIAATWATVGFLFCKDREELLSVLPPPELRPGYRNEKLSNYAYIPELGRDEESDPYYYGASLLDLVMATPRQEIATHTLSHFYCLEDGSSEASFEADLRAAIELGARRGLTLRSIVFPRNQYDSGHLEICRRNGLQTYRGNPASWAYRPAKGRKQTPLRRALRLADAHLNLLGTHTYAPESGPFRNVQASQFLRPCAGRLARFHGGHRRAIMRGMDAAAREGRGYHLWWHPHNFGLRLEENLRGLEEILRHFARLREEHGMVSRSMAGAAG
jgi:peptidoglycan/xylan/chitin deacetylase (PgdA/CDA1 family)